MDVEDYFDADVCDISGATVDLSFCRLIGLDAVQSDALDVARQEWVFGLPRGGLIHYLRSRANTVVFRQDITKMFCRGEFILVPTFRTYLDCMAFIEHKGVKNRSPTDRSRRRPLTALKSHRGLYRYVFIPFTDAARALQAELNLQPQTPDDLNNGIYPLDDTPMREGTDSFPVLECAAHPFSICEGANKILWKRGTELTGQWHNLVGQPMEYWIYDVYDPPRWFLESPVFEDVYEDVELTPSVASGYAPELLVGEPRPDPSALLVDATVEESDYRKVVADWSCNKVIYGLPPPEEEPIRTGRQQRRSARLRKCPCDRGESPPSPTRNRPPSSPTRGDSTPSPTRNVPNALIACCRNYEVGPPSWVEQNGGFPSYTSSRNDWAFFQYGIHLPGAVKT